MTGQTISHYLVLEKLGEGGMGVVYKAEDSKLRRLVALKFLPPHARGDEQRFVREAQAAASHSHPNICIIYEIDEENGFIAMEFIEGRSVKDRIAERPLPLEEAIDIAIQTCAGLQAAHEKGITHRDIKPANLMLTVQGQVKIMDFGLAQIGNRTRITRTGVFMGTPAYMSPEQARLNDADRRTDIWALGASLYEMIAGQPPFGGAQDAAVVNAILHTDPEPLTSRRAGLPIDVDRIVAKALAKDPDERYQHVDDLVVDLRRLKGVNVTRDAAASGRKREFAAHPAVLRRWALGKLIPAVAALGIALAAAAGLVSWSMRPQASTVRVKHLTLTLPQGRVLSELGVPFALSDDGNKLVFAAGLREVVSLYIKSLDSSEVTLIRGTFPSMGPFFSPDAKWIGFKSNGILKKVPSGGGIAAPLCEAGDATQDNGAIWMPDGIYFSAGNSGSKGIMRVSPDGGNPVAVTTVEAGSGEVGHLSPYPLPGGRAILFTLLTPGSTSQAAVQSIATGQRKVILHNASRAQYLPTGHLVFSRGADIYAVPFDLGRLEPRGEPVQLIQGVSQGGRLARFSVARDGTLVYASVSDGSARSLVWVDRNGQATPLSAPKRVYATPHFSPDGQRVAINIFEGERHDIWLYRPGGELNRFTFGGTESSGVWAPDSSALTFSAKEGEKWALFHQHLSTGAQRSKLYVPPGPVIGIWPAAWTPDASTLLFMNFDTGGTNGDLFSLRMGGSDGPRPYLKTPWAEFGGRLSRDGRWVTYASSDSGRFEVYIAPYLQPANRLQVSVDGGTEPVWAPNGRELFYRNGQKMMAAQIRTEPVLDIGKRVELFEGQFVMGVPGDPNYDVSHDGTRFLMIQSPTEELGGRSLQIVVNWFEELARRVPLPH